MALHQERVNAEFKRVLSDAIRSIKDPRFSSMTSISNVEVSRDLKHANVLVSVYDSEEKQKETLDILNRASGLLAHEVNNRMRIRRVPQMHFVLDQSIEYSVHIGKVLDEIHTKDQDATTDHKDVHDESK